MTYENSNIISEHWKNPSSCDPEKTVLCERFKKSQTEAIEYCNCYRTKIPIYMWDAHCWKCGLYTPHVSYYFECGSCEGLSHHIGDLPLLDKKLTEFYFFIKKTYSYTMQEDIIANTCIHCESLQGNFFILEELIEMGSINNILEIDKWI